MAALTVAFSGFSNFIETKTNKTKQTSSEKLLCVFSFSFLLLLLLCFVFVFIPFPLIGLAMFLRFRFPLRVLV